MSQINEYKIGIFEANIVLTEIENIIKIISSFEGKVFGEYVREVIVPRMKNPDCDVTFNSIDVWFQNQTNADNFIKLMNIRKIFYKGEISPLKNIDLITFHEPRQYFLRENSYVKFNIIFHPSFPLDNFDVNYLAYFYLNDKQIIETGFPEDKKEQIIEAIYKKEATMTKYYFSNMINHRLTYSERSKMINELFENRGWIILYNGIKFTSPFIGTWNDALAKEKFVNEILLKRDEEKSKEDIIKKKEIPIDFQWSPEKAEIAKHNNTFIRVGGIKSCYRLLSGALRSWTSNDLEELVTIFNIKYRITGTPSNISIALKNVGYGDNEIKRIINDSINRGNYSSSKEFEYLGELERYRKFKELKEIKKNTEEVIYIPEYRIRGTPSDISNTLKLCGYGDNDIKQIIDDSITRDSFSKEIEYLEELERHKNAEDKMIENSSYISKALKFCVISDKNDSRKQLIDNFILSDELFKAAIINRNKAFFECISDLGITEKDYISNNIIEYPETLSSKIILENLITKK
jgi:hypothetical protein